MCALKESLTSRSHGAIEIDENQMQNLIRKLVKLQLKLNSQPLRVSIVKVRALRKNKILQDPTSWDGDMWQERAKTGYTEPLNSESSLQAEEISPTQVEGASPLYQKWPPHSQQKQPLQPYRQQHLHLQ